MAFTKEDIREAADIVGTWWADRLCEPARLGDPVRTIVPQRMINDFQSIVAEATRAAIAQGAGTWEGTGTFARRGVGVDWKLAWPCDQLVGMAVAVGLGAAVTTFPWQATTLVQSTDGRTLTISCCPRIGYAWEVHKLEVNCG